MKKYCMQCALERTGTDTKDLAGITERVIWMAGGAETVRCAGCGGIQVDPEGRCVSKDCEEHGHEEFWEDNPPSEETEKFWEGVACGVH